MKLLITLFSALIGLATFTVSPLLALWLGSQLQGQGLSFTLSICSVIVFLTIFSALLLKVLLILNGVYQRVAGLSTAPRRLAWLSSYRDQRQMEYPPATGTEKALVVVVVAAVIALTVWFLAFAKSSIAWAGQARSQSSASTCSIESGCGASQGSARRGAGLASATSKDPMRVRRSSRQ
jgi:hypothetical protein